MVLRSMNVHTRSSISEAELQGAAHLQQVESFPSEVHLLGQYSIEFFLGERDGAVNRRDLVVNIQRTWTS